jgi:hypothetical protein
MVSPPPDVGNMPSPATASRTVAATPERGAPAPSGIASALDRADIKPLDVPAALQILIAEVRAAFELLLAEAGDAATAPPANLDSPALAARALVETVLQSLPDTLDENAWGEALPRMEAALQSAVQSAVDAVSAWRDASPVVVATTKQAAQLALQVLGDEPQNPLWLRPEWLATAPRLTRFWRRRRAHRRRLTDPDYDTATKWDESDDYAQ